MGYIGQMPQAPDALPGRETSTGEPPQPKGPRADELPTLLPTGSRTVSLSVSLPAPAEDESPQAAEPAPE